MKATIEYNGTSYQIDFNKPIDISLPLSGTPRNVNAWYVPHPEITPVHDGDFVGSVKAGASTNFNNIFFNPHGHGTHTECIGHITKEFYNVNDTLKTFFFAAELISVTPQPQGEDLVISKSQIEEALNGATPEAIVIRTFPNTDEKLTKQYSNTNPPYLLEEAALFIKEIGIKHLLIDLPSVDKEKDNGALLAHKAFWNFHGEFRLDATITEFIYVPTSIVDGSYLLNLQMASFVNDASPSKPVLYKIW
ncbi:Kynurenine formamidase [Pustulibacterium marinum]|uniref:Kynurenine formamidase n=1 Tax=Pustulibacterium marinum TaxID=1224947 RepID=A0A1I7I5Z2_9FLAO|nr:cyclase family protein [Pustulibacterium marinum]SFU68352.1 Kynurenine formamidase [Pustulibacterium marinum]